MKKKARLNCLKMMTIRKMITKRKISIGKLFMDTSFNKKNKFATAKIWIFLFFC